MLTFTGSLLAWRGASGANRLVCTLASGGITDNTYHVYAVTDTGSTASGANTFVLPSIDGVSLTNVQADAYTAAAGIDHADSLRQLRRLRI